MLDKAKWIGCALLLLAQLTANIGCSVVNPPPEEITGDVLIERLAAAHAELHTYQYDMEGSVTISGGEAWSIDNASTSYRRSAVVDNDKKIGKFNIAVKMPSLGQISASGDVKVEMYFSGNWTYMATIIEGMPEQWLKSELPEGYWEKIDAINGQIALLKSSEISITGDEKVDGTDCYVVRVKPDKTDIWEAMKQQLPVNQQIQEATIPEDMVREIAVIYWIAKDTFLPKKEHLYLTAVMSQEHLGITGGDNSEIKTAMELNTVFHGYGTPVSIEIPPEAKDAPLVPASQ